MVELSLTSHGQTLQTTIDEGQAVALGCSMIFTDQVFPPFSYTWLSLDTFNVLSTNATYFVTPDSHESYLCVASAFTLKATRVRATGIMEITIRGTYICYSVVLYSIYCVYSSKIHRQVL